MRANMDHIVVNARDAERVLAFYTDVIGLEGERVDAWRAGEALFPSVRLNADTLIDIFPPAMWGGGEDPGAAGAPTHDHICLCVGEHDWHAVRERIAAAGVTVELEPTTLWGAHGNGTSIYVRDPEGKRVELRYYP